MKNYYPDQSKILYSDIINTPLGNMIVLTNEQALFLLKFEDAPDLNKKIQSLLKKHNAIMLPGKTSTATKLQSELNLYFQKKLTDFSIPLCYTGTPFQQSAWHALLSVPLGQTRSYSEQSFQISRNIVAARPRAVAQANAANLIAIVIPCHRIINKSGSISGYNGGIHRKQWLLKHEMTSI